MPIILPYISILANISIGAFVLIAIAFVFWFANKSKQQVKYYKDKFEEATEDFKEVQEELQQESQSVDLHREELLSQTEHLQDLNVELERLSLVASHTDTSVAITNEKGEFVWVNHGFVSLFEYELPQFVNKVGRDVYTASTMANIQDMIQDAFQEKKSLNYTSKVVTRGGVDKWVKTTLNPIFDESGNFRQFIILDTDVSELKNINDKLKKLSLVASKTSNSVIIFDSLGKFDWVNEGFLRLYGMSKLQYIAKHGDTIEAYFTYNKKNNSFERLNAELKEVRFVVDYIDIKGDQKWKQVTVTPVLGKELENYIVVETDITRIKKAELAIQEEKNKADKLLLNILPEETSEELKSKGKATPRFYRSVSVLFADIQEFTALAENMTPEELVEDLQTYFSRFDDAVEQFFVEKIKTMGDAFLCVGGVPMRNKSHPFDTVLVGLELQRIIIELAKEREDKGLRAWQLRIGIHSGPVVAGVVGKQKMTYDIWGDTVNIAKRIESACLPGMVNISASTYEILKDFFECEHRGKILAKNKGHIDMYFVHKLKSEFSENGEGIIPNHYFKEMLARM